MTAKTVAHPYNRLPRPTFHWMKVNYLELDELKQQEAPAFEPEERHEGDVDVSFYQGNGVPELKDFQGANADSLHEALHSSQTGCAVTAAAGTKSAVWLTYSLGETPQHLAGQLTITAEDNSDVTVYLLFDGGTDGSDVNFLTYVKTGEHAHVKISKVQLHHLGVRHVEHRYADAGKNSVVDYVSAELGAKTAVVYYKNDLMHDESEFNSKAMYLATDDQVVDFSYWVPTQGIKTKTDILTTGALLDSSKKFFRGTIDFLRGGKKAVGSESDVCILLSPQAHSISLPLLLCKEDDVVGNHASSAGQIDQDKLFYLMSRGFSEAGAQLILIESNIRPVIDALGDKTLENKALQAVRAKMQYCKKGDCHDKCTQRFPHID